jgi:hypothetical protein
MPVCRSSLESFAGRCRSLCAIRWEICCLRPPQAAPRCHSSLISRWRQVINTLVSLWWLIPAASAANEGAKMDVTCTAAASAARSSGGLLMGRRRNHRRGRTAPVGGAAYSAFALCSHALAAVSYRSRRGEMTSSRDSSPRSASRHRRHGPHVSPFSAGAHRLIGFRCRPGPTPPRPFD